MKAILGTKFGSAYVQNRVCQRANSDQSKVKDSKQEMEEIL